MTQVVALFIGMLCISSIVFQVILFRSTWLEAYIEVNIKNEVFVKIFKAVLLLLILFSIFCTGVYLLIIAMGIILSGRY
jgi:succinate dehydrogenase/fumarate reductase cytochrome b subunit